MATVAETFDLAVSYHQSGALAQAEPLYRQILQSDPAHAGAHHFLGLVAHQTGHNNDALAQIRQAIALDPTHAVFHLHLGVVLHAQGDLAAAIDSYREALRLNPDYSDALANLGITYLAQDRFGEAINCFEQSVRINPQIAEVHNNLGIALRKQGRLDEAAACYRRALALAPDFAEAQNNLGVALYVLGNPEEAAACYRQALALKPDYTEAHTNLGNAFKDQRNLDAAADCYRRALTLKPDYADAHWNQSLLMLLRGDFESGWPEYEWRWQVKPQCYQQRYSSQPRWDGTPLTGRTILIHAEQGFGDTIQFVRYLPLVKERGGTVIFECQAALAPLLGGNVGADQLLCAGARIPPFDVQAPLLSLPGILGTRLESIHADVPYVRADSKRVEHWRAELEPLSGVKIGIAWQGSQTHTMDRFRSFPLAQFGRLARVKGVRLLSLQKGPGSEQLQTWPGRIDFQSPMSAMSSSVIDPLFDLGQRLDKDGAFLDTAAIMMNLDLVVAVDSAVAHLAGALRVPAWVPLTVTPDWRWLLERADSPWYPTMRLFRQKRFGEWDEVFERIAAELSARYV